MGTKKGTLTKAAREEGHGRRSESGRAVDGGDDEGRKSALIRDSFTIPKAEYDVLQRLKERAASLKRPTKKSEVLRAGVAALDAMSDRTFLSTLNRVQTLKTGRPKGDVAAAGTGARAPKPA